jgi:hypothetical protein
LPFAVPKQDWDLYDADELSPLPPEDVPSGQPEIASRYNFGELRNYLDGHSLADRLTDPAAIGKDVALTQWPEVARGDPADVVSGLTAITRDARYTEWTHHASGEIRGRDPYDLASDPRETANIIDSAPADQVAELQRRLHTMMGKSTVFS